MCDRTNDYVRETGVMGFLLEFLTKSVVEGDTKRVNTVYYLQVTRLNKPGKMDKVKLRDQY